MVALVCWLAILAIPALVWRFAPGPVCLNGRATLRFLPPALLVCTLLPALLGGIAGGLAVVLAGVHFPTTISRHRAHTTGKRGHRPCRFPRDIPMARQPKGRR